MLAELWLRMVHFWLLFLLTLYNINNTIWDPFFNSTKPDVLALIDPFKPAPCNWFLEAVCMYSSVKYHQASGSASELNAIYSINNPHILSCTHHDQLIFSFLRTSCSLGVSGWSHMILATYFRAVSKHWQRHLCSNDCCRGKTAFCPTTMQCLLYNTFTFLL